MYIALENKTIIIKASPEELLTRHRSQLDYYGFKQTPENDVYYYNDKDFENIALKVISYFRKQHIEFTACEKLKQLIEEQNTQQEIFERLKERASNFKNASFEDDDFQDFCLFLKKRIPRKLKPHQIKAAYHHYILRNAANFSVPGSGKTSTILSVYEKMRIEKQVNMIFVVGPTSSFTAWKNEFIETLGRSPKSKILSGGNRNDRVANYYNFFDDTELLLTSFQSFANDYNEIIAFFSHVNNKVFFVVDEAHYIKQIDGVWAKAVLQVSQYATAKYILTGTPCPKSYSDLFNMFDFLWGKDVSIPRTQKLKILMHEKNKNYSDAGHIIKHQIDPLFYRVRKKELGLLKQNFHSPILIDMNYYERLIYEAVFRKIGELSYFDIEKNILTLTSLKKGRMIRLRQLTSYAKLLSSAVFEYKEEVIPESGELNEIIVNYDLYETPKKIEVLVDLINKIQCRDKKVLVWSNFIGTINLIEHHLKKSGINCNHIYGETPIIDTPDGDIMTRERIIAEFLNPESKLDVLIANPGACAESISLHKGCYHAIYYDLSYNCAQYLQSLDRIHRVGGSETNKANYYYLQYVNTIDADILNNLQKKRDRMYHVIEYDSDIYNLDISVFDEIDGDEEAYERIFGK